MNTRREDDHGEYWADVDGPVLRFGVYKLFNWLRGKMKFLFSLLFLFLIPLAHGQDCYSSAHNMVRYSDDLTNAVWTKPATIADVQTSIAPPAILNAGTSFSATLVAGQFGIIHLGNGPAMVNGALYEISVLAKYGTRQFIGLGLAGGSTQGCSFDIQNGAAGVCTANFSDPEIENKGDGWWRLSVTHTGVVATFPNMRPSITNQTSASAFTVLVATGGEVVYLSSPQAQRIVTGVTARERGKYVPNLALGITWAPARHCDYEFLTRPFENRTPAQIAIDSQ